MKDKIQIFNADAQSSRAEDFVTSGGQYYDNLRAEGWEAVWAGIVLGFGLGVSVIELVGGMTIPFVGGATTEVVLGIAIFGTIEVPRLNQLSNKIRMILMAFHSGMLLTFIPQITSNVLLTGTLAFVALFVGTIVNASVGSRANIDSSVFKRLMAEHSIHLGLLGGFLLFVVSQI